MIAAIPRRTEAIFSRTMMVTCKVRLHLAHCLGPQVATAPRPVKVAVCAPSKQYYPLFHGSIGPPLASAKRL